VVSFFVLSYFARMNLGRVCSFKREGADGVTERWQIQSLTRGNSDEGGGGCFLTERFDTLQVTFFCSMHAPVALDNYVAASR
jgi:hypothetical protein